MKRVHALKFIHYMYTIHERRQSRTNWICTNNGNKNKLYSTSIYVLFLYGLGGILYGQTIR